MTRRLTVEADGGSRGNPGVAGYGALVRDTASGRVLAERAEPLGKASNNVAEYRGLIAGLEAALDIDPTAEVLVRMDSKLVVEQMAGRWKIKHEDMRRLALEARDLVRELTAAGGSVRYEWIPREKNKDADALSNVAMDGRTVDRRLDTEATEADPTGADGVATGADQCAPVPVRAGTPVRVVLVAEGGTSAATRAADAVTTLLGEAPRCLLTGPGETSVETSSEVGSALGVEAVVDAGWVPERAAEAWERVVARGGTTVVVTSREAVRAVLGHVLGIPEGHRDRLAVAEGSLAGVEVWDDDRVSVAFTNRT